MQGTPLPNTAMVLAAGLGTRMRPLSDSRPKSLLPVAGRAPLDRALDRLAAAGVARAAVNLHYKAETIRAHLAGRAQPEVVFSDESDALLDTGGGVARALPLLGDGPLLVVNAISLWLDEGGDSLRRLAAAFEPERMDALLLLHPVATARGYDGAGDFELDTSGRLARRPPGGRASHVFIGVQLLARALFDDAPTGAFSLNLLYDRAAAAGRLHGLVQQGAWFDLKTPQSLALAERALGGGAP
jgi:MurNAc alpha-1-phosphate uridylyltransferase